ncbi:MAG: hypothetical protein WA957_15355 [Alteraurantiacibacter sp.]
MTGTGSQLRIDGNGDGSKISLGLRFDPLLPGGTGQLLIENDGSVELTDSALAPFGRNVVVQVGEEATGEIALDNGTLSLLSSGDTNLSFAEHTRGQGTLLATNGSVVELLSQAGNASSQLGNTSGANKTANLIFDDSDLMIAVDDGDASFQVGGVNTVAQAQFSGAGTDVSISAGGVTNGSADVRVGDSAGANSNLLLESGASMVIDGSTSSRLRIGDNDAVSASVNVLDSSALSVVGGQSARIQVGAGNDLAAPASLNLTGTAVVSTSGDVILGNGRGDRALNGIVSLGDSSTLNASEVAVNGGGVLQGTGTVTGNVAVNALGILGPGLSPGVLTIDGDLTLNTDAGLFFEFGGTGANQSDYLTVLGDFIVNDMFSLTLSFINGYSPQGSEVLEFLDVGGNLDSSFFSLADIEILGLADSRTFSLVSDGNTIATQFDPIAAIPVPLPAGLLLTSFLCLGLLRRRH